MGLAFAALAEADRFTAEGDRELALAAYGDALDHCLHAGLTVVAASVAQRMIAAFPDVVRARLTLAVLSLAEALDLPDPAVLAMARSDFRGYTDGARAAGREHTAARHLTALAEATESPSIRELAAEMLADLGAHAAAEEVFLAAYEEREGIRSARARSGDQRMRWIAVLTGAAAPAFT